MSSETMIGTIKRAFCSECRGERNCDVVGFNSKRGDDGDGQYMWVDSWYLLVCRGCDHTFAQTVHTNSEDFYHIELPNGDYETEYNETIKTWPAQSKRERPEWFNGVVPADVDTSELDYILTETYAALDNDLRILSASGVRTSFDAVCSALGVDPAITFSEKLDKLKADGHIKDSERDHIATLVEAGSASVHRGWMPSVEDLDALMDALESLIFDCMVLPHRKRTAEEKMAKVKLKVPPRPVRARKSDAPSRTADAAPATPAIDRASD